MLFSRILCPTDFSESSRAALEIAAALARDHGAELLILHAVETLGPENLTYREAVSHLQPNAYRRGLLEDLRRLKPSGGDLKVEYLLLEDDPVQAILKAASERCCDLIVMGTHGRTGIQRLLMGSVAEQVVRRAACPVLVVKAPLPHSINAQPPVEHGQEQRGGGRKSPSPPSCEVKK
jgi:nucleotide-binding universal stress UspA family protein